jgi:hypothetical protein
MFFRILDPTFFHPRIQDPRSEFFPSRIRIKEFKIFNPKKWFLSSRKYDPGCSFRIPDLDPDFLSIPDPGVKKAPDPDPQYYPKPICQFRGIDAWGPESLKIRAQGLSPFTQTYVL